MECQHCVTTPHQQHQVQCLRYSGFTILLIKPVALNNKGIFSNYSICGLWLNYFCFPWVPPLREPLWRSSLHLECGALCREGTKTDCKMFHSACITPTYQSVAITAAQEVYTCTGRTHLSYRWSPERRHAGIVSSKGNRTNNTIIELGQNALTWCYN